MTRATPVLSIAVVALIATGCSKRDANAANAGPSASTASSGQSAAINACDQKLLTMSDVADILVAPITGIEQNPNGTGTCTFSTGSFPGIVVTLDRQRGKAALAVWQSGKMPTPSVPVAGVGDEAVWVEARSKLVAEKNNLLCDITARGARRDLRDASPEAVQKKLGALCNKIFAAVR